MVVDLNPSSAKADAPTNPLFSDSGADVRISTAISTDATSAFTPVFHNPDSIGLITLFENMKNLNATKGFRIKCYDSLTQEGIKLNSSNSDINTHHYFVLVYSDDYKKHHFARITEVLTEDEEGDSFEFEPKLGNEIPANTQYLIIKGPSKTNTNIVAFSAAIKNDDPTNLSCARPLFYFFNDYLDKKNELDHNTKYYCMQKSVGSHTSLSSFNTTEAVVFRTVQDFGKVVIDYSKFTHRVTLTDNLRTLDDTVSGSIAINEGGTITADTNDFNKMFPNATRDANDDISTRNYGGPKRYLHYGFSPTKANLLYHVYEHTNTESIDGKGGLSRTSIVDNGRIMLKKVKEFTPYRVRNLIHRADLEEFFPLDARFSSASSNTFTFNVGYDLRDVLNTKDEIKLGDKILIINDISAPSGNTQEITLEASTNPYARGLNDGAFTEQVVSPSSGDVLYRRAYNPIDNTLMLDTRLITGRFNKLFVAFSSLNNEGLFAEITACDGEKSMITLSFPNASYNDETLRYMNGEYLIYLQRFDGEVENIETKKEEGQSIMTLEGRDKFNKLLSPIINLNTLFTEDIIYSSHSPYNKVGNIKSGKTYTIALGDTEINTTIAAGPDYFDNYPVVGTKLYGVNGYIGEVTSLSFHASVNRKLVITPAMTELNNEALYMDIEKNYVLNKALSSSHIAKNRPTSLIGSANKGIIFTSGAKVNMTDGTETETLVLSSSNHHPDAIGYSINSPSSIDKDNYFQAKLHDEHFTTISQTCSASSGSTTLTVQDTTVLYIGLTVSGNNLAAGTTIAGINSDTEITLSVATTGSLSGSRTFSSPPASFDTVNTLIDFEVLSSNKKDNDTIIELAPYVPITMGAPIEPDNLGSDLFSDPNNDLYEFTTIGTNNTLAVGRVGFSVATAYDLKIGDALYEEIDSSTHIYRGSAVHYYNFIGKIVKKSVQTDSSGIQVDIYLDNSNIVATSATVVKGTRKIHDIGVVNGSHLWGGKILCSPHPKTTTTGAVPLNIKNTTGTKDYNNKFGQMYYKIIYLANGNFSPYNSFYNSSDIITNWYQHNKSLINYHVSTYRINPNISTSNTVNYGKTDSSHRVLPLQQRGNTGPYGSNMFSRFYPNLYKNFILTTNPIISKRLNYLHDFDASASRKFLYITSDNLPYSSLRKDSLMHQTSNAMTKNINNYNMMLMQNPKATDTVVSGGALNQLKDSNFQNISFSTDVDISTLKRFSLMRLTEVCVDCLFNPINPEKPILKKYPTAGINDLKAYQVTILSTIAVSGTSLTCSTSLTAGDKIYDSKGNFIGTIASGSSPNYTLTAAGKLTNDDGTGATSGVKIVVDTQEHSVYGRNVRDTAHNHSQYGLHPLKGIVVPEDSNYGKGSNDRIRIANSNSDVSVTDQEIYLPISLVAGSTNAASEIGNAETFDSKVIQAIADNKAHKGMIAVMLDRFSIEQGGKYPIVEGNTSQVITANTSDLMDTSAGDELTHLVLKAPADYGFKNYDSPSGSGSASDSSASGDSIKAADGAYMVFKPRLWIESGIRTQATDLKSSNGDLIHNEITVNGNNEWLEFIDLTGCYLASENGKDISQNNIDTGEEYLRKNSHGLEPTTLAYVISHEIDESNPLVHHIITDAALPDDTAFRILQPNEVCFYDFMPTEIMLNTILPQYTKVANKKETYDIKSSYFYREGGHLDSNLRTIDEGIGSMFVVLDTDRQTTETDLVIKDGNDFIQEYLEEKTYSFYLSDGENGQKRTVEIVNDNEPVKMIFDKMFSANGVVSVSEPFTVNSKEELKIIPTRACIGSTVQLGLEGNNLINELLEQEGIEFELPATDNPIFLAPNYQGVDLYSALRFILERKDLTLIEENGVFKVKLKDATELQTDIIINDSGDYYIFDFEKVATVFDFYNEIIVYGSSHKAIRKDIRSIQKRGRKTLEVVDNTLNSKQEVEKRASALIRLHSNLNQKLSITLNNRGINQLRVGDIIHVEITRENIEMREYVVLQMEHQLSGFVKLELGRYSKDLADVFSELFLNNRENKAALRSKNTATNELAYNFLDTVNIRELKLLVRTRTASGGFKFGFATALNTATTPFGFAGGAITYNNLIDEDLV